MSDTNSSAAAAATTPEIRRIRTKEEARQFELEMSAQCEYYKVWFTREIDFQPRCVWTPAYMLDADRDPIYKDGKPVIRPPFDAALDAWVAVGVDEYTIFNVQLGSITVLTLAGMDAELKARSERGKS